MCFFNFTLQHCQEKMLHKFLTRMKFSFIFLFIVGLQVYATGYSQSKISMNAEGMTIRDALKQIEKQTSFRFFYSDDLVYLDQTIDLNVTNSSIDEILTKMFNTSDLGYRVFENNMVVVSVKEQLQQGIRISGKVTDADNNPLPGVNVVIRGTVQGAVTDINGAYSLQVPDDNVVLVFSFVGYTSQEIVVGGQRTIHVTLSEDTREIEEVVVIGYGTVRKSDLTGSVVSIQADKFKNLPQTGTTSILQGKAAGVNITSVSGAGDKTTTIRIRGVTSLSKSSEPLWVVDGVIMPDANSVNVNDIQSIEVLKDASSTAIYGSQGANGVILVTTKRAAEGVAKVTLDTRFSWNMMRKKIDMLDAQEMIKAKLDLEGSVPIPDADLQAFMNGTKQGVNWFNEMTRTGFGQSYMLNISGGSEKTKYKVSANVSDNKGQWVTINSRTYIVRADLDADIAPWLNLRGYVSGSTSKSHNNSGLGQFENMLQYSPLAYTKLWDEDAQMWKYPNDPISPYPSNPLGEVVARYSDKENASMTGFANLTAKLPIDGLTFSVQGLYTRSLETEYIFEGAGRGATMVNNASDRSSPSYSMRNINNLTYQKQFGDHRITAMAVLELSKSERSRLYAESKDITNPELGYWGLEFINSGGVKNHDNKDFTNSAMVSAFGRVIYSYKGKYLFTGTYRADAASQFRDKYKWGYFPSAAVGWNISEEDFMNKDLIQLLKLRASVGVTGNHGVGAYATILNLTPTTATFGNNVKYEGLWLNGYTNPDIHWEKTTSYDVGFDLGILKQRLNLTVDWYYKITDDLLFQKPMAAITGVAGQNIWVNQGRLDNDGWEFTLNGFPFRTRDFIWESTLTAAYNHTVIKDLAGEEKIEDSDGGRNQTCFTTRPGLPVATFWLNQFAGFDEVGNTTYLDNNGNRTVNPQRDERRVQPGSAIPKWTFGWNNQFIYKNWDLNIFMRATGKYYRMNIGKYYTAGGTHGTFMTTRESYYKRWDKVADKSKAEYCAWGEATQMASTQWLEMAQFLRLQNITLGYQIPKATTRFADIHLAVTCENLFVLTKYSGMDPETVSSLDDGVDGKRDQRFGLDNGSFPIPRTFTFTVRFDF